MTISSELPPKATIDTFTADSASYQTAVAKFRNDTMHREIIAMSESIYRLKRLAEKLTPKTVHDWNALDAREQERAIELVRGLRLSIQALIAGSEEE